VGYGRRPYVIVSYGKLTYIFVGYGRRPYVSVSYGKLTYIFVGYRTPTYIYGDVGHPQRYMRGISRFPAVRLPS